MKSFGLQTLFILFLLYFGSSENLFSQQKSYNLEDTSFEIGQTYTSLNIRFQLGRYNILPYSFPLLDSIAQFLLKNDKLTIEIRMHRDSRGSDRMSTRPTHARAKSVFEYLEHKGVHSKRMRWKGFGESVPNIVYEQEDTFLLEKPTNGKRFEKIVLAEAYINQFREKDKSKFDYLHQLNRRTEFKIVGFIGEEKKEYFNVSDKNIYVGQVFGGKLEFRFPLGQLLTFEDYLYEGHPGIFDSLVALIKSNSDLLFEISAHTDARGTSESNFKLSEKRAIKIAGFFLDTGVSNHQLRWKGLGENEPITAYLQNGKYLRWKPENNLPFEKIVLTEEYINQFKSTDKAAFDMLHQMNRRTEIKIVGTR